MKLGDLAHRPDLRLGGLLVSPARRLLQGPQGTMRVEPLTMQLLLVLLDAHGQVVTRDLLFERCWGGAVMSDASLNRAIASVRRAAAATAPGTLEIETIPRTGYRLTGPGDQDPQLDYPSRGRFSPSRRFLVGGGLAVVGLAALGAGLAPRGRQTDPRTAELMEQGRQLLREELPDEQDRAVRLLTEATRLQPDSAPAWALLALAWRNLVEHGPPQKTTAAVNACQAAARRALALDPANGDAHAALARMWPIFGDWLNGERRLRRVLAIAPDNVVATSALGTLLQSVGRVRESAVHSSRSAELDPLSPIYQFRRTFGLWCTGRLEEADRTIDRAARLWPHHPAVWNTRLLLFAMTDRPHAALAMLDDPSDIPPRVPPPAIAGWRSLLGALADPSPARVQAAMEGTKRQIARSPAAAVHGICAAARLGRLDDAFAMADAYLLRRGALVGMLRDRSGQFALTDQRWQMTMMLFIPSTAPMRADPRFRTLSRDMGMTAYWDASGTRPDDPGAA